MLQLQSQDHWGCLSSSVVICQPLNPTNILLVIQTLGMCQQTPASTKPTETLMECVPPPPLDTPSFAETYLPVVPINVLGNTDL